MVLSNKCNDTITNLRHNNLYFSTRSTISVLFRPVTEVCVLLTAHNVSLFTVFPMSSLPAAATVFPRAGFGPRGRVGYWIGSDLLRVSNDRQLRDGKCRYEFEVQSRLAAVCLLLPRNNFESCQHGSQESNCFVMFIVCSLMKLQSTETLQPPESTCSPEQQTTEVNDPSLFSQPQLSAEKTQEGRASSSHPLTAQNSLGDSAVIHSDHNGVAEAGPEAPLEDEKAQLPPLAPPLTWTFPIIKEFKAKRRQEEAAVLTVYRGDVVTVHVPTVPEGKRLCWEFATDNYDIGFGIYFDWMPVTSRLITVHVSESSDDEDDEGEVEGPVSSGDIERGSKACPVSHLGQILPVYRQDSHLAVQAGHHEYPGEGMYLLKFDNSYSLWRNKTLYYRVYYSD
ncbi:protein TMED8-like [Acipenser oxyrinchus oxyrinchus]|uniref:Protein TMED8-like n=1 Tax=Acipenser oxyrinchus oxyrinchus TaxID=40147 RepID=A0AAD8FRD4_ACIOX|nr:protein TMED8-like [Acipenser oxyrinchus oxyrinchus]